MAEQRSPEFVMLLRKPGKRTRKIELFAASLWSPKFFGWHGSYDIRRRYRLRIDGKWRSGRTGEPVCYGLTQFMDMLRRAMVQEL